MKYLIVHTEASPVITSSPRFAIVDQYHRTQFDFRSSLGYWVGYHYFIEKDGKVIQARADNEMGAHCKGFNDNIGIALAGNGDFEFPTQAQVESLTRLLIEKSKQYNIPRENIVPHRFFLTHREKTCYGVKLSNDWARNLVPTGTFVSPPPTPVVPDPELQQKISLLRQTLAILYKMLAYLQSSGKVVGKRDYDHTA